MKHTFYLKQPKSTKESLIYFSCYFKDEKKKFVYSTGENIIPSQWDFENNQPLKKGKAKSPNASSIKFQLDRYSSQFESLVTIAKQTEIKLTSKYLKDQFNSVFKVDNSKHHFFDAYEKFMNEKMMRQEWQPSTIKRYKNLKNMLIEFEAKRKYYLNFNNINASFLNEYTDFCYRDRQHCTNTFARNLGLLTSFLNWSFNNKLIFSTEFKKFKKPSRVVTKQEALKKEEIEIIYQYQFKSTKHEITKDLFVFQCLTGLRYGDLKNINKGNIAQGFLIVKDDKNPDKPERSIPLLPITEEILVKYNYKLPQRSNQKQNEYIKEILQKLEFNREVEYTVAKGAKHVRYSKPFYDRITTHKARRFFITIMRNYGVADKTIMSISGHKDIRTFNMYHQVDDKAKIDAVRNVFS